MNPPEPSFNVKVDVTNPGQFFACCGLLEVAHRLWPGAEGWFGEGRFCVATDPHAADSPLDEILGAILASDVESLASADTKIAPLYLGPPLDLQLDWWLAPDGSTTRFKTWSANATSHQMYTKWKEPLEGVAAERHEDGSGPLLTLTSRIQGSYGFDSAVGWTTLDVGFSLNEHRGLKKLPLRPAVEALGAIGLQRFLPPYSRTGDSIAYAIWSNPVTVAVAGGLARGALPVADLTHFHARFVKRGSFKGLGQAITTGDQRSSTLAATDGSEGGEP